MSRMIKPEGPQTAKIMLVGEAPGVMEVGYGSPFYPVTKSNGEPNGGAMLNALLKEAGIDRRSCRVAYVYPWRSTRYVRGREIDDIKVRFALKKAAITQDHRLINGMFADQGMQNGLDLLLREIETVRPNVIVPFGNVALWATTGRWKIGDWRGSLEKNILGNWQCKVIPTISPDAVVGQMDWKPFVVRDLRRAKNESNDTYISDPVEEFILGPSFDRAVEFLNFAEGLVSRGLTKFAFDIENPAGYIDCISFAWSETDCICIPFVDKESKRAYFDEDQEAYILHRIYKLMTHPNFYGITQNGIHEAQYIDWQWMFTPNFSRDTMIDHHALVPTGKMGSGDEEKKQGASANKKNLGFLSSIYRKDHRYWKNELDEWETQDDYWRYNCRDSVATYEIHMEQQKRIDSIPKQRFVADFKQSLFMPTLEITRRGLKVDLARRDRIREELVGSIKDRQQWIEEVIGHEINLSSAPQLQALFYSDMQQRPVKVNKGGEWRITCDDDALVKIAEREPLLKPLISKIQEMRSCNVLLRTFIDGAELTSDNRLQCIFDITGTKTDRFAHKKTSLGLGTNMGNIPKLKPNKDADGLILPNMRELYIPDEGYEIADGDLKSADLQIVAAEARCRAIKDMFKAGLVPYVEMAREYYRNPSITKKHWAYPIFKAVVHGTDYAGTSAGIAGKTGLLVSEVERAQKWYFGMCPEIPKWHKEVESQVKGRGWVENVFGRRFYYLGKRDVKKVREALAWIAQSAVAWIIDMGLINIYRNLPDVLLLNQVHDSLVMEFEVGRKEEMVTAVLEQMCIPLPYEEPLTIEPELKTSLLSWGDCE